MEVELYVYDLSNGLARTMSAALLGTHIDAVYHTSIVFKGIEYVYDGGIRMVQPGMTHLGKPLQTVPLGRTTLPMDVIMDYLESMKEIYTTEAYDLWTHNCNNFSNDIATFLTGKGIPGHITNLPRTVLDSPFGRMLKPTVDDMVKNNMNRKAGLLGIAGEKVGAKATPETSEQRAAAVKIAKTSKELDEMLSLASGGCAIIFFTSYTCAPCRILYPLYDQLAAEAAHKGTFMKVDIAISQDIAQRYSIGSTPTFVTFLRGEPENRWSGADAGTLRGNVKVLLQMAWPPHPHESLRMPAMHAATMNPILYGKVPPLEKLLSKMGDSATNPAVQGVKHFVEARSIEGAAEVTLPNLDAFSWFIRESIQNLPPEVMFTIVDLLRAAMFDSRFSGYYAEEKDHKTIAPLFGYVNSQSTCPYALRLVALQTGCNLFSSPLYIEHILSCPTLTRPIVQLITTSLLDDKHHVVRVAGASLSFNIASANSKLRTEEHREGLADADQVELVASLLEAIGAEEESAEALKGLLLAFGYLVYCLPKDGELVDLLKSMDAHRTVTSRRKFFPKEPLISEIGNELLGKGL